METFTVELTHTVESSVEVQARDEDHAEKLVQAALDGELTNSIYREIEANSESHDWEIQTVI
jgi:hypothetical protein